MTDADLAWHAKGHIGLGGAGGRVYVWGKEANNTAGWDFAYYDIATDAWTTVWSNQNLALSGHIFGNNAYNPDTGDQYLHGGQEANAAYSWKWNVATGAMVQSPASSYTVGNDGSYDVGAGFHPNAYGTGDGAFMFFSKTRAHMWRQSTNTWAIGQTYPLLDNVGSTLGQCDYLPGLDAMVNLGNTTHVGWKVTPGPTFTSIPAPPIAINAGSVSGGNPTILIRHPSSTTRLWILETQGSKRIWESTNGGTSWTLLGFTNPFTQSDQGYIVVSLIGYGCFWQINKTRSVLWKPNT